MLWMDLARSVVSKIILDGRITQWLFIEESLSILRKGATRLATHDCIKVESGLEQMGAVNFVISSNLSNKLQMSRLDDQTDSFNFVSQETLTNL